MIFSELETDLLARVVDNVNNSNVLIARISGKGTRTRRSAPWVPPVYTDMRGWMALNYLVLGCVIALAGLLIWSIAGGK